MIQYQKPGNWTLYDAVQVSNSLASAKAAVLTLKSTPYQRSWVEGLQQMELKREVAGTSQIEGADFTENELNLALQESPEELITRSQRQAHAASKTYRWIASLEDDRPITADLIREIHARLVAGADDDHCCPGRLRLQDENVTFGQPRHRGVSGGIECADAFSEFVAALNRELSDLDPLLRALVAHYHFAAMHPFLDGNGRTARALEALLLQRAGLRDFCFIAMSNYYYDEKTSYLKSLAQVRAENHDLTPFLIFALRGIEQQTKRVLNDIQKGVKKALFRNMMFDLYNRLETPRKRILRERQLAILKILLEQDIANVRDILDRTENLYQNLRNPVMALYRDLNSLIELGAIRWRRIDQEKIEISLQLDWPEKMTETEFFKRIKKMPRAKSNPFV